MTGHGTDILAVVEAAYHQHFEVSPARASVSFLGVDKIEVLRYDDVAEDDGEHVQHLLSLGMSRYPMADPAASVVDAATAPRAELMTSTRIGAEDLWKQFAVLAAAPAVEGAVYSVGNRIDLGQPLAAGSRCTGAVLTTSPLVPIKVDGVADVEVLKVVPATATELAWARVHGTEALLRLWEAAGTDLTDLARDPVALS